MTVSLKLTVNGAPIDTDYFVAGFIDHTVSAIVEAFEGTGEIRDLTLSLDDDKVTVNLNGAVVPTNTFAGKIIKSTILGMLSPLKGVTDTRKVSIVIHK